MTWYSERMKGSRFQKVRHRHCLILSGVTVLSGFLTYFYSPLLKRMREAHRRGEYDISEYNERRRFEIFTIGVPVGTMKDREENAQIEQEAGQDKPLENIF